jgi:ketosteroid isomerase-like protein
MDAESHVSARLRTTTQQPSIELVRQTDESPRVSGREIEDDVRTCQRLRRADEQVGAMWLMLTSRATNLRVELARHEGDDRAGNAHWIASYTFATGRSVVNDVCATLRFADGLIADHEDRFSFHAWSRQALGPGGLALGWTPILRAVVRRRAAAISTSSWPGTELTCCASAPVRALASQTYYEATGGARRDVPASRELDAVWTRVGCVDLRATGRAGLRSIRRVARAARAASAS